MRWRCKTAELASILAWLDRRPRWTLGGALVLVAALVMALTFDPRVSRGGDNALYYALARSLAETGSYRNLVAPGEPYETSVPWGYPALLAVGMALFGPGYVGLVALSVLAMLVAVVAMFESFEHRATAFLVVLVVCLDDFVMQFASKLLTEAPYMAASFGTLALVRRGRRVVAPALLASCAYLIRPIGISLIAALVAWLAVQRRWKDLLVATIVVTVAVGSWHLRCLLVSSGGENLYVHYFLQESKYQTSADTVDALGLVARFAHNARIYGLEILPKIFAAEGAFAAPVGSLLLALIAVGYAASIRRLELAHFYLPLELLALCLWLPESIDIRYLAVVFPLLVWFAFQGADAFAGRVLPAARPFATLLVFACCAGGLLDRLAWVVPRVHAIQREIAAGDPLAGKPASDRSFVELCDWLSEHSEPDAVVASRKARLVWYYSDRKAVDLPATAAPDDVVAFLETHAVDYVVLDSLHTTNGRTRSRLEETLRRHADRFVTLYETAHGDSVVRFVP